jgi:hypothetical protein
MFNLGVLFQRQDNLAEAEHWYRRAADTDDLETGASGRAALARLRPE